MGFITEKERKIDVFDTVDVLVVGGGPGGLSAAIASARTGVKTMLIERYGCFGGNMTVVGVETLAWYRHEKTIESECIGIEFERRASEMGATTKEVQSQSQALNTELFKHVADTLVRESGVIPLLHCFGVEPIVENSTIKGVITESKSGRKAILAKVVIDGSGDADIAFRAGAPCIINPVVSRQAVTLVFNCCGIDRQRFMEYVKSDSATYADWGDDWAQQTSGPENDMFSPYLQKQFGQAIDKNIIEKSEWDFCGSWSTVTEDGQATYLNLAHLGNIDVTDIRDLTRAEMEGREQVLEVIKAMNHTIPGFENARLRNFSMSVGTRDSRKIAGEYNLTGDDVMNEARFEDSIGIFPEFVDGFGVLRLPLTGRYFQIPYRSIIPQNIDNLLVAGRSIAGDQISHAATRSMMCCAVSGQGAGIAAATSVKLGIICRHTPITDIQQELARQNVRCTY
jgi:hypothetical protein